MNQINLSNVTVEEACLYIANYVMEYRGYYDKYFTMPPPEGAGYPKLLISPYLTIVDGIFCYLANDGAVIAIYEGIPDEVPGLLPKPIRIYGTKEVDYYPPPNSDEKSFSTPLYVEVKSYDLSWEELINKITINAFNETFREGNVLGKMRDTFFWNLTIIRDVGIVNDEGNLFRIYPYMELLPHLDKAAWDIRNIPIRVVSDIRRDFAHTIANYNKDNGSITVGTALNTFFYEKLDLLKKTISDFEQLLNDNPEGNESIFHRFIEQNPIVLDVYGEFFISKYKFRFPEGEPSLDKVYVEPDIIIRYPGNKYKIVELEKPGKNIATVAGQTSSNVTQAAFQIAEFKTYIVKHYERIKDDLPGISTSSTSMIVIGRQSEKHFRGYSPENYMEIVSQQFPGIEIVSFDDLLSKAKQAYIRLTTLTKP